MMADDADSPIIVDASKTAGLGLEGLFSHPPRITTILKTNI